MDTNTLWVFLQRILSQNENQEKTELILQELEDILRLQSSADMADIVKKAKESLPESQEIAREKKIGFDSLEIAVRRANARKLREEAMRQYSRCWIVMRKLLSLSGSRRSRGSSRKTEGGRWSCPLFP